MAKPKRKTTPKSKPSPKAIRKKPRTSKSKAKSNAKSRAASDAQPRSRFVGYAFVLLLSGMVLLAWMSLLSFDPVDPPSAITLRLEGTPVQNQGGIVGAYLAYGLRYWLGGGAYVLLGLLTAASVLLLMGRRISEWPWRAGGVVLFTVGVSGAICLANPTLAGEKILAPGGVFGTAAGHFLMAKFGTHGSWLVTILAIAIGAMLTGDHLLKWIWTRLREHSAKRKNALAAAYANLREQKNAPPAQGPQTAAARLMPPVSAAQARAAAAKTPTHIAAPPPTAPAATTPSATPPAKKEGGLFSALKRKKGTRAETSPTPVPKPTKPPKPARQKPPSASRSSSGKAGSAKKARVGDYILPSQSLLAKPLGGYSQAAEKQAGQRKLVLQQTLDDFGVQAKVVGYETGPVITLFEVALEPGVKTTAVGNLSTDIARSLAVSAVRIVPPRFGKDTVGIEVPNLDKEMVRMKELMVMMPKAARKMALPMYLGKDAGGGAIVVDLAKAPHMLIAGTTGSGKSVCINTIIMSLLMTRTPEQVRLILVDPKMVEMAAFEKLPHLLCPTINDMKKAEDILEWSATKMDERYEILREAGVKNLAGYNSLSREELYECFGAETDEEKEAVQYPMPQTVIIIDELADLMMTSSKEVEGHIIRIAQKARAVGIHLVLATQRPSANVVTGLIKSNMPCRISFRVASGQESRIVLDQKGAEVLLGQGDMLVLQPGTSDLDRAQGTYMDDDEIRSVVKHITDNCLQRFDSELLRVQSGAAKSAIIMERDEMFDQAVAVVLQQQRGSVSLLQRRMGVGYGRASRIIDQMADAGILGEHKGSQARECMMTAADWEQMKADIAADQAGQNSLNGEGTSA